MSRMPSSRRAALAAATLLLAGLCAAPGAAATTLSPAGALAAGAAATLRLAPAAAAPVVTAAAAGIVGVPAPVRALDTRTTTPLGPNATRTVTVAGLGEVPATAKAVLVNLTSVAPEATGYLSVFAAGSPPPQTSNLNLSPGSTVPNSALVPVGTGGAITVRNASPGRTNVIVDVQGFVTDLSGTAAGTVTSVDPARLLDTRAGTAVPANSSVTVKVAGRAGVPATGAGAVAVNLTVVTPAANGHLTAWASGTPAPGTSVENFVKGQTRAGYAVVPLGNDGSVTVYNASPHSAQLVVDVFGYVAAGDATQTLAGLGVSRPNRVYDGRTVQTCSPGCGTAGDPVAANDSRFFNTTTLGIPADASGVLVAVTAVGATAAGSVSVPGPAGPTSVVNFVRSAATTNVAVLPIAGGVSLTNGSSGQTYLIVDVLGWVGPQMSVSGQVRSTDAGPVAGARVYLGTPNRDGAGATLFTTAGTDGSFAARIATVRVPSTAVCASGPLTSSSTVSKDWTVDCFGSYASQTRVPEALGTSVSGVDIALSPAGSLALSVHDYAGAPVTSAVLTVVNTTTGTQRLAFLSSTTGAITIDRLEPGDYVAFLGSPFSSTTTPNRQAGEWADDLVEPIQTAPGALVAEGAKTFHVTAGAASSPASLVADANGSISGTLLDAQGNRVSTSLVRVYSEGGQTLSSSAPAPDGSFRIRLHAGAYTVCGYAYVAAAPACWSGSVPVASATPVSVVAATSTDGINIVLP